MEHRPSQAIRPSAIAGTWYPGQATALRETVERFLSLVPQPTVERVVALVCPHAGYRYSGPTAAHAYRQVQGLPFRRVILLGPLHRPVWGSPLGPYNVPTEAAFRTPLGDVAVDHDFVRQISREVPLVSVHGDDEHSLEIQLPFLQVALESFAVVPIMIAESLTDPGAAERLEALVAALAAHGDEHTLVVCSTDLSHLDDYEAVRRTDAVLLERLGAFDVDGLAAALRDGRAQACGAVGLAVALRVAKAVGAARVQVLNYTTSGDVTGDRRQGVYTVGYVAAVACA